MSFFTPESIERLYDELHLARRACNYWKERLVFKQFKSNKAKEFGHHGAARRLEMLTAAVEHVFDLIPPGCDVIPEEKNRLLCELSLQAFWINASGCLDNLAWLWILENDVKGQNGKPLKGVDIGLLRKQVRDTLPPEITAYLASIDEWLNLLTEYRDTLAHRIPPYIPPFSVDPGSLELYEKIESDIHLALLARDFEKYASLKVRQNELIFFIPVATHSFPTATTIYFHAQILSDHKQVVALISAIIEILDTKAVSS